MTAPFTGSPSQEIAPFDPALLWEQLVGRGMGKPEAETLVREHLRRAGLSTTRAAPRNNTLLSKAADALVAFGQGASFGLADTATGGETRAFLAQDRNRTMKLVAELAGTAASAAPIGAALGPLTAGASTAFRAGAVGAATGAAQGAGRGTTGAQRTVGAVLGGAAGLAGGAVGGRIASRLAPNIQKVVVNVQRMFGRTGNRHASETLLRTKLSEMGIAAEDVERAVERTFRQGPVVPGQSGLGRTTRAPVPPSIPANAGAGNPLMLTEAEQAAGAAVGPSADQAARTAYTLAKAAGQSEKLALEAARRAGGFARGGGSSF